MWTLTSSASLLLLSAALGNSPVVSSFHHSVLSQNQVLIKLHKPSVPLCVLQKRRVYFPFDQGDFGAAGTSGGYSRRNCLVTMKNNLAADMVECNDNVLPNKDGKDRRLLCQSLALAVVGGNIVSWVAAGGRRKASASNLSPSPPLSRPRFERRRTAEQLSTATTTTRTPTTTTTATLEQVQTILAHHPNAVLVDVRSVEEISQSGYCCNYWKLSGIAGRRPWAHAPGTRHDNPLLRVAAQALISHPRSTPVIVYDGVAGLGSSSGPSIRTIGVRRNQRNPNDNNNSSDDNNNNDDDDDLGTAGAKAQDILLAQGYETVLNAGKLPINWFEPTRIRYI